MTHRSTPSSLCSTKQKKIGYRIAPTHYHPITINTDYQSLASWIIQQPIVVIDGYTGVDWEGIQSALSDILTEQGIRFKWYDIGKLQKSTAVLEQQLAPFMGGDGHWGCICPLNMADLYPQTNLHLHPDFDQHIIIGPGAALFHTSAPVIYAEHSKLTLDLSDPEAFKRFYYIDRVIYNEHKAAIRDRIKIMIDATSVSRPAWVWRKELNAAIDQLLTQPIRLLPWFAPGPWGGQWLKAKIDGLPQSVPNYAWGFELVAPESMLLIDNGKATFGLPFEWLMYDWQQEILGRHAAIFGSYFPIRFDFLDTIDGGHLSIQCHPSQKFIQKQYNEPIAQDETYYILEAAPGATVFLGLRPGVDTGLFRQELTESAATNKPVAIGDFVQEHPSAKHDLFLIPNGAVHSAGKGNLVLEISATPYLYTFKMYDWLRPNLDGELRPISIEEAFANLRPGYTSEELVARPRTVETGNDWQITELPTHPQHFYNIRRLEFDSSIEVTTDNRCLMMILVEGESIRANGAVYYYLESFVNPAAVSRVTLTNNGSTRAYVLMVTLKDDHPVYHRLPPVIM
jgi:mannose-6-phosphate isomerase class I